MPFLDEAQPATRPIGGRFLDDEPSTPFPGIPQTSDLTDRLADAATRGFKFYQQSELVNKPVTQQSAREISRLQSEIEDIPSGPGIQRFQQAQGWGEAFKAIAEDPVNTIGELMAESLGALVPKAVKTLPAHILAGTATGAALGAPFGVGAGLGALTGARAGLISGTAVTSYSLEYAGKVLDSLREQGVDIKDPDQLAAAFANPQIMDGIREKAVRKGVPIAAFDAFSALLGGRLITKPARTIAGKALQLGGEVGTQAGLGMAGETAGELAAGEKLSPSSILAEGLIEVPGGVPEIAIGAATRPRATRRIGETYDRTPRREILPLQPQETAPEAGRTIQQPSTSVEERAPSGVVQVPPLEPEFPLRPGTKGTPWEDQQGYPIRQNPQTGRWERIIEQPTTGVPNAPQERSVTEGNIGEYPNRNAPRETTEAGNRNRILGGGPVTEEAQAPNVLKVAPVQFLQVQEGMPELVWYKLTGDITSPDGRVYPAGRNISNGELARFGYTVPESELAKSAPAVPDIQVIGQVTPEQQPLLNEVLARIREENANTPGLPIRRVELHKAPAGVGIVSTQPGRAMFDTVALDLDQLSASGIEDLDRFLSLAINEEIIHNAGGRALQDEWSRSDQSVPFQDYWAARMDLIAGEMTPAQRARVSQVYGQELTDRVAAAEFVRMLVQERMRGQITEETLGRNTIQYLKQILRRLLDALRTATGTARQNLQQHVNAIEEILRGQQQIRTVEEQQQVGLTDDEITRLGAASPSLPTLRWNPNQSQAGFGLMGVAALNNPAAEPLKMAGRINPQQLINRLRTILPPDEWAWYQNAGIERLAGATALADVGIPGGTAGYFSRWLQQNGPKVEVKELNAAGEFVGTPEERKLENRYNQLGHLIETSGFRVGGLAFEDEVGVPKAPDVSWQTLERGGIKLWVNSKGKIHNPQKAPVTKEESELISERGKLWGPWSDLRDAGKGYRQGDSATARYTSVNPKPLDQMPGAVDILVRVPTSNEGLTQEEIATGDYTGNVLFSGPHFGASDKNVLASVRGYMETLPNGRKTFHIFEVQSDWGQRVRELREQLKIRERTGPAGVWRENEPLDKLAREDHPLLRDYNRLALKAAIKHAIDNGADSITISDAETAMLTEGHDRNAHVHYDNAGGIVRTEKPIITQEPGMRLNYDQVLPRIARELTGMEGATVDFGKHKNAFAVNRPDEPNSLGLYPLPRSDLVFKNPDGTPKTSITGREFNLAGTKQRLNQTGGVFPLFGSGKFVSESPFDRMRRESGAEPPPELTPEQERAREINERIRGRRPETLSAARPFEDEEGKPTNIFGVTDYVTERPVLTSEQLAAGRAHAKTIFDQAGIKVVEDPEMDGWRIVYDGEKKNAEGQRLVDLLTRELATQHQEGRPQLAPLINAIRLNFRYGTMDQLFDLPVRLKLYAIAQGEASRRGIELRALAGLPEDITFAAQNIDVELQHIYSEMAGGKEIQRVLDEAKKETVKALDKKTPLAAKPEMQQEIDKANATRDASAKIPNASQLAEDIFKQQFESFDDLVNALKDRLMKEYNLSPQDATKVASKFKDAFAAPFKAQAEKSLQQVRKAMGQIVGAHKGTWDKIQKAISKGIFNNLGIVQQVAKELGMKVPTDEEIKSIKALAARERQIGSLTEQELEEYKKMGTADEKLQQAKEARIESTTIPRGRIRKQLELIWGRLTKPIPGLDKDAWRGFKNTKRNLAAAINEFMSANLLFKIGFPSRLGISVLSQWLVNTPTRAIGNALVRYNEAKAKGQQTNLLSDMAMHLGDSFKAQYNALIPALSSAKAALLGRGEARNIDRLMSGMNTMERLTSKAKEYYDQGDYGRASILYLLGSIKMGYRVAQAMDQLQGIPAEYQEMRGRVINGLLSQGMSRGEALARTDWVIGDMKQQHAEALADTKKNWEAAGVTGTANEMAEQAWNLVKLKQYQRIKELGLPADEFREQIKYYRNVLAWNEAEHKGIGGGVARFLQRVEQVAEAKGFPTAFTRFSNAIGITINRALAFTPFYKQADYGGYGTSGWFKTEADKQQRRVEAFLGTTVGTAAFMLALSGAWLVRRKWPKDKEEQDLWQQEGHRPGTVEVPVGDGTSFIPISLNNSPLMFVAPYLAAGGALHDLLIEREAQQKKLDEEAAKTGAVPGQIRPMSFGDMALVAVEGAKQAIIGGRTPAATLASVTYYGLPNAKKMAASYVSPAVPGLPALQEVSRMAGVALDERFATLWDFMLPLPGSESRRLNMLGDPVKTPNDVQRITQIMTGGNYPLPIDAAEAKSKPAYDALFNSGYRPPSINPAKGYQINGQFRPMNNSELDKYIELRGRYFKEGLIGAGAYIGKADAQRVYDDANRRALSEVGVMQPLITTTAVRGPTTARPTAIRGPRRLRTISRLRRPRLRRLSYRRPRLTSARPRLRRIRRLAA